MLTTGSRASRRTCAVFFVAVLVFSLSASAGSSSATGATYPRYPIASVVKTTLQRTIIPATVPTPSPAIYPYQINMYPTYGYGRWTWGAGVPRAKRVDIMPNTYSGAAETNVASLLRFFTITDIHITDEETPAGTAAMGYMGGMSSAYSPVMMLTTQVLDAAIQTINALNRHTSFDFGLSLGDAANNAQTNELRWYVDTLDGKVVSPDSGVKDDPIPGPGNDYQDAFRAAGLDKGIPWYQVLGNHDHFWIGSLPIDDYIKAAYLGTAILDLGNPFTSDLGLMSRGTYVGALDGRTVNGTVYGAGPVADFATPPQVPVADPNRKPMTTPAAWMAQFFDTTSKPVGHGFTQSNIDGDFASYSFEPRAGVPIKVIALDDTESTADCATGVGGCGHSFVDQKRYDWLISELDKGQAEGKLMIIAMHIPIGVEIPGSGMGWSATSAVTEAAFIAKLHTYPNLLALLAGHRHVNCITPFRSPDPARPELGFWQIETSSLRDWPQEFRTLQVVRNNDGTVSILATDVDPAVKPGSLAALSRTYAVAAQQLFQNSRTSLPSAVDNVELVKQLTPQMAAKLAKLGTPIRK
ncbi:MAG: TIGR03768 family metallophosphoesterase [Chloroflexota bacterium]